MRLEHFNAVIRGGHKEDAVEVPFDPSERWSISAQQLWPGRRGFAVTGTINGTPFESAIVSRSRRFWLLVSTETERKAGASTGDSVVIEIAPDNSSKPKPLRGSA
ncbi:MAG: DUF1905 domain-containing protein [Thermoanaerobaculia bacterium]|nr:DUF1905 domain-containing protein [Thermoanaerobaculia bacterium]